MSDLTCRVQSTETGVVVSLIGAAHNDNADAVHDALARLQPPATGPVVVDLRGLSFMASRTIAELIDCRARLQRAGRSLRLAGANDEITNLLRASRLSDLFAVYTTPEAALAAED